MTDYAPMSEEDQRARARMLKRLEPGARLLVTNGIKKGRTAVFVRADLDNPWLLAVLIDKVPRVVRWDWVTAT